jgi:AAHS family 4-hydroxybenzoate transporter-like MFS transporter
MTQKIDVAALLDHGTWSMTQKFLIGLIAVAVVFDGFDIQILGFAIPSLMKEWHAARSQFGPVLALGLAGMVLGGPVAGYCGDRFGRRITLAGCVALFALATIGTAFVNGFLGLSLLRVITGMGTGGALPNVGALTSEFAPLRWRPMAIKLSFVCVPLGGMLGGLLAASVIPTLGWRGLYGIGGVLPLVMAVVLLAVIPESPRFLARRPDRWPELAGALTRIGHSIPAGATFEDRAERDTGRGASMVALFGRGMARETVGLWVAFFFCLGSIYLVFGWLPTMLTSLSLDIATANLGLAVYNLGGVLGVLVWAGLVTMLGSRGPLLSGTLACAGSALALLVVPIQAHGDHTLLIVCLGINGLLANAVQVSMYALAAYVYPTRIRATGVAYAATAGRVGGLMTSLFGASVIQAGAGTYWQVLAIAMICSFAGLVWVRSHFPRLGTRTAGKAS